MVSTKSSKLWTSSFLLLVRYLKNMMQAPLASCVSSSMLPFLPHSWLSEEWMYLLNEFLWNEMRVIFHWTTILGERVCRLTANHNAPKKKGEPPQKILCQHAWHIRMYLVGWINLIEVAPIKSHTEVAGLGIQMTWDWLLHSTVELEKMRRSKHVPLLLVLEHKKHHCL